MFHVSRREQVEKHREARLREDRKLSTTVDIERDIISNIPYVNSILADRLLAEMQTVEKLFSASETELTSVEGIGRDEAQNKGTRDHEIPSVRPSRVDAAVGG